MALSHLQASLLFFVAICWSPTLGSSSPVLDPREVISLKQIAKRLGKMNWDFGVDPCSGGGNWTIPNPPKGFESKTDCDCSFRHGTLCHVTVLWLKGENLAGVLPPELAQLRHLQQLDLSRSVIRGGVPEEWGSMKNLQSLSLMGNRLSGPFPVALTKIASLINLTLEANHFSGPIPPEIGKLVNLSALTLSSNNFSGAIPSALSKLVNLSDLRLSDTNLSGKIPDFLRKLTRLEKLHIQGCPMEGPIPSGISTLTRITDLRISDLKGDGSGFPDVRRMSKLKTLLLRNCSLSGELPSYIGYMTTLKYLGMWVLQEKWKNWFVGDLWERHKDWLARKVRSSICRGRRSSNMSKKRKLEQEQEAGHVGSEAVDDVASSKETAKKKKKGPSEMKKSWGEGVSRHKVAEEGIKVCPVKRMKERIRSQLALVPC